MKLKIYLASSWRNLKQPALVQSLRAWGHQVYDFREPEPGGTGFSWTQADPKLAANGPAYFAQNCATNEVARHGFCLDRDALNWCNVCVLLLPCGRSAHLEAGYAAGQGKHVLVYLSEDQWEPELMYLLCSGFVLTDGDLKAALSRIDHAGPTMPDTCTGW